MDIAEAIVSRIFEDKEVTLSQLENRALERGISLSVLYDALATVHRDKRVKRGVRGGEVYYCVAPPPKSPTDHLKYVREHYPPMTAENDGSGFDIDLSFLFLKGEALDKYKAAAKGRPYVPKARYEHSRTQK